MYTCIYICIGGWFILIFIVGCAYMCVYVGTCACVYFFLHDRIRSWWFWDHAQWGQPYFGILLWLLRACLAGKPLDTLLAQQFADFWTPGQDVISSELWYAPLLQALLRSYALLIQDYGSVEWIPKSVRASSCMAECWLSQFFPNAVSSDAPSTSHALSE